jgi:uncharacterized protein (TIGR00251 family)
MKEDKRLVRVKVIPNSDRSSIQRREDEIKIKVTSPAQKGKANRELLRILYRTFGTRDIKVVTGRTSRSKLVRIRADQEDIDRVIRSLPTEGS